MKKLCRTLVITLLVFFLSLNTSPVSATILQNASNISSTQESSFMSADGVVRSIASDGTYLYIGGDFTQVGNYMGSAGMVDTDDATPNVSFPSVSGGIVYAIAPDGSGGWYVGGSFTQIGSVGAPYLQHIKSDYSTDSTWLPAPNGTIYSIAISGSNVYVAGVFTTIGGQSRTNIAKLNNTDGDADASWTANANNAVWSLAISGSSIYAGGAFTTINGTTRNRLAKISTDGTLDATWNPSLSTGTIYQIVPAVETGTTYIYIGGAFSISATIGGANRNRLAKLDDATGAAQSWNPNANSTVYSLALSGSDVYAGGTFTSVNGGVTSRNRIAKFNNSDGTVDGTWNANLTGPYTVYAITVYGGDIYAGGSFETIGGQTRYKLAKLDTTNGNAYSGWNAGLPSTDGVNGVRTIVGYGTNIIFGGQFDYLANKATANRIARFSLSDRSYDPTWIPSVDDGGVYAIHASGTDVYIGGSFTTVNSEAGTTYAAKLNSANSTVNTAWLPTPDNTVKSITTIGTDIYLSGDFTTMHGDAFAYLVKVNNSTGEPYAGWTPSPNASVRDIEASGSALYVGGTFTTIGGASRKGLAQLNTTSGTVESWNPQMTSGSILTLHTLDPDIFAAGSMTINAATRRVAHFNPITGVADTILTMLTTTGDIIDFSKSGPSLYVGGDFEQISLSDRYGLAKYNYTTGAIDTAWHPSLSMTDGFPIGYPFTLYNHYSGLFTGGSFDYVDSIYHYNLAFFPNYNVVLTETDNGSDVKEGSTTDTFTVALTNAPTSNVTIALSATEGVVPSPSTLTFTSANWDTTQTVTLSVPDNGITNGTRTSTVTLTPTSSDTNWNALTLDGIAVTVTEPAPTPTPTTTSSASSSSSSSSTSSSGSSPDPNANVPPGTKAPNLYSAVPVDSSHIRLSFAEGDDPIDRYILEYGTKEGEYPYSVTNMGGKGTRTYTVGSLLANTPYYFHLRAAHGTGVGPWSNVLSATTKGLVLFNQLIFTDATLLPVEEDEPRSSDACTPYIVKSGDTLWNIAQTVLGDSRKYKEIIEKNKKTYPSLITSNSLKTGWTLEMPCSSESTSPEAPEGYNLNVRVVNTNKQPVEGATVTIHSQVQETTTDKDGIAHFTDIEKGDHKVLISYRNSQGEQSINLTGENKEFDLSITIQLKPLSIPPWIIMLLGGMGGVIVVLSVLLWKKSKKNL